MTENSYRIPIVLNWFDQNGIERLFSRNIEL